MKPDRHELARKIFISLCSNPSVLDTDFWEDMVDGEDAFSSGIDFSYRQADELIKRGGDFDEAY